MYLQWKCLNFDYNINEVCSQGSIYLYVSNNNDNDYSHNNDAKNDNNENDNDETAQTPYQSLYKNRRI